jgi:lysine-N-methylase
MPRRVTALRYMTRFSCVAERCEDNCCVGMKVMLSAADRDRLAARVGTSPEGRARLEAAVEPVDGLPEGHVAVLRTDGGGCRLLAPDRLCSVHRDHGAPALPDVCARFPRTLSHFEDRVEVAGSLGCPEAARLCLTAEDAVEVVEAGAELIAGLEEARPRAGEARPYVAWVEEVLATGSSVLQDRALPLPARVLLLAELGRQVDNFFHQGADAVDGERLRAALAGVRRPEVAAEVAARAAGAPLPVTWAMQALVGLFSSQPEGAQAPARAQLVPAVLSHYLADAKAAYPALGTEGGPPFWEVLLRRFQLRQQHLAAALGGALEPCFERFLVNDWHREWYAQSPSLSAHAFKLAVRLCGVEFLVLGHPVMWRVPGAAPEEIERAVVESVQVFARHVDRNPDVMPALEGLLTPEALGTDRFGRVAAFMRILSTPGDDERITGTGEPVGR